MKKKTINLLGLLLIAGLGLTACGTAKANENTAAQVQEAQEQKEEDTEPAKNEEAAKAEEQKEDAGETAEEATDDVADDAAEEKTYDNVTVKLGIMGGSDETVWDPIVEEFKAKGVNIEYVFFTDYTQPNAALNAGDIDINSFQHYTYLNKEKETFGYKIDAIGDTLITALNVYSDKVKSVEEIPEGGKIAIPNDAVNGGRALNVLQAAGLIKIADGKDLTPTVADIEENEKNLEIIEVDASQTASLLPDVDAAVINGGFALDAGLSPINDSIFFDDPSFYKTNAYVNVIAARTEDKDNELYQEIVKAYQTDRTKEIYANDFQGLYIAAWE